MGFLSWGGLKGVWGLSMGAASLSLSSECFFCWERNIDHPLDFEGKEEETVGFALSIGVIALVLTSGFGGAYF
jgi:hypothetical protein